MRIGDTMAAILVAGLCFALVAPASASADTALGESTWSLEVGTDLSAGSDDASIAIRRHMGAGSAWRFGVEADLGDRDGDGVLMDTGSPDEPAARWDNFSFYALTLQWMRFAAVRDNVTATFAIGPVLEVTRSSYGEDREIGTPGYQGYESTQKTTAFGVDLGLGFEWFLARRLSLGGQASLRATTGTTDLTQIQRSGNAGTYNKTELRFELDDRRVDASAGRIKLTGYF